MTAPFLQGWEEPWGERRRRRGARGLGSPGRGHPGGSCWQEEGGFNWEEGPQTIERGCVLRAVVGSLELGALLKKRGCRKGRIRLPACERHGSLRSGEVGLRAQAPGRAR